MENGFSNLSLTTSNQSIQGDKDYKVKRLDFDTSCPCQITACDGGSIKICAPVVFEDGFTFTGNICDDSGGATFQSFTAFDGYYLELSTATCATTPTAERLNCIGKWTEGAAGPMSVVFQNFKSGGAGGGGYIAINSTSAQPVTNPGNNGLVITGGSLANTKNVNIGSPSGELNMGATENISIDSTAGQINMTASQNLTIVSSTGDVGIYSQTGNNTISADKNLTLTCDGYSASSEFLTLDAVNSDINTNSSIFQRGLDYPLLTGRK